MFIVSMKANRKKVLIGLLLAAAAILAVFCLFRGEKAAPTSQKLGVSLAAETNEQRIAFLKNFGWEVEPEPSEIVEVAIPAEFGEVYASYNEIQKKQGFDLGQYREKRVKRYTYVVCNYPNEPEDIRANLLVYEGKIIGGDICSLKLEGFMHGFRLEKK